MPKKETKTLIITLLSINIISISLFVFLFYFTESLIAESVKKEDDIKMELKKEDAIILMKEDLSLGKMYQDKLMTYVVPSGGTVDFIKTLEQLVLSSGLKSDVKSVSSELYDKGNSINLEFLKINIDVIGEWKNVQFFLTLLENYPLKININKISLNKFSDYIVGGKSVPQWAGNFEFTVVKIKDAKQ